ncbi:MAG: hypothetical protein LBI78_03130 [Campylobacteraceae bacterium]|jgi:hypothetical protein|nr:hypothetical protein [Campylobacteraceae bacterium]
MFLKGPRDVVSDRTTAKILFKCIACILILYFFPIAIYPIIFWIGWLICNYEVKLKSTQICIDALQKKISDIENSAKNME